MKNIRVILNGKSAGDPNVRDAVGRIRAEGQPLEVRTTWEQGDAARFAEAAVKDGVDVLIAGGGDGTVHEVANGLMSGGNTGTALAILPLGTANDFATACGIPENPFEALSLAVNGNPVNIDLLKANGSYFINVASGGFGAEITADTPVKLKKALGGSAYALEGIARAAKFKPYTGHVIGNDKAVEGSFIVMSVGNSRLAGGGANVAPMAMLDDGLMDVLFIRDFLAKDISVLVSELRYPAAETNSFVHYRQLERLEVKIDGKLPLNLDGEPERWNHVLFEVEPRVLPLVLPDYCPLISPKNRKK